MTIFFFQWVFWLTVLRKQFPLNECGRHRFIHVLYRILTTHCHPNHWDMVIVRDDSAQYHAWVSCMKMSWHENFMNEISFSCMKMWNFHAWKWHFHSWKWYFHARNWKLYTWNNFFCHRNVHGRMSSTHNLMLWILTLENIWAKFSFSCMEISFSWMQMKFSCHVFFHAWNFLYPRVRDVRI